MWLFLPGRREPRPTPTDLGDYGKHIQPLLTEFCTDCHGEKKQQADFFVHDIDGSITGGKDIVRWEKILEMVSLGDMPPKKAKQPSKIERAKLVSWLTAELRKIGRGLDEGKLALPQQANRISHEELFSGEHPGPAYSPARLWRKNPYIYDRFARELRTQISQPFLGIGGRGIQDYAKLFADESTIKTMLRNSHLIAENLLSAERSHVNRHLNVLFMEGAAPTEENIEQAVISLFDLIFQRAPTSDDREYYVARLFEKNREVGGLKVGVRTLIVGMLMSQEFVYRLEIGLGEKLPDGRRMLSPDEIAHALSFAFFDKPDPSLLEAAREGKLATREDVAREARRLLDSEDMDQRPDKPPRQIGTRPPILRPPHLPLLDGAQRDTRNLHLSLLHAAGAPDDNYGDKDLGLGEAIDQSGPLSEWMA